MQIGVPREIKNHEYRVGLTPASVRELSARGHTVMVQGGAGAAIGLSDEDYRAAGAVLHYCVANMPGNVARTSTFALNNATLPHALALADKGWLQALRDDPHLKNGLNVAGGQVTCEAVATQQGRAYVPADSLLG
jgi:alanine dehydrogenase